jgi:hypothetical protein
MNKTENGWAWLGHLALALVLALSLLVIPLAVPLLGPTPALAATITSAGSGNWNSTVNNTPWPNGVVPALNASVVIALGNTVTIPQNYTATCGDITINGNLTLNGPNNPPGNLHVFGGGTSPVTTGAVSGGGKITGPASSGGTNIEFTGDWSFSGTLTGYVSFYFDGSQDQNTAGGNVFFPRNLFIQKTGGTVYFPVTPTWTNYFHITNDAGTVCYNRNDGGAQSVAVPEDTTFYYYNLTLAGSGSKTILTSGIVVHGTLSMEGTANASAAPTYGGAATLRYNRTASQSAGPEWSPTFGASGGVIIANTGTVTLIAAKTFSAGVDLTINSGATLAMSTFLLTLNGDLINNGGTTSGSGGVTIAGTATQSIGAFTTTGTVSMNKTAGVATFQGNVSGGALTINRTGGTLNLGSGLTHTFTGTWTRTAGILDGGSSTLNLGGGLSGTGGTFTANTSTVNYNAAGAQTVAGVTYYNLTTSGSGTKTLGGAVIVSGDLTIGPATTLDVNTTNYALTVQGDWTNNGNFTPQSGTVTLNGSSAQNMTGATTFYNLTLNNSYGLTIYDNVNGSHILNLTSGNINTGINKVIIPAGGNVSRTSGYVIGNLQKNVTNGTNVLKTFEVGGTNYTPVNVTFASVTTAGNLTAKATSGDHPSIGLSKIDATKSVNVYWSLTNSGIMFTNYSATFNFTSGDIDAGANTAKFIVGKYNGTSWSYPTVGTNTTTSTQATGMTSFSDFAVGEAAVAPTVTTTGVATVIADISATCGGNITATGGANATSRGINYGTTTGYGSNQTETGSFGTGAFTEGLTGLSPGTLYHYQAFAANSAGTGNGNDATFLTLPDAPTNFSVTAQTSTSINLSWTIGTGADTTIVRYNTSGYPTSPTDGNSGYSGSGTNCTISSLSPGTLYYFAAWSSKTAGGYTQYSSLSAKVSQATVAAPTVTTGVATVIADTSATCGGNITATGGANVTSRGINYGTTTGYGSNRTETGSFGTGAFTENLTGLSPGTLYHYQAFAANSAGTGNGSDATFLILPDAPTNFSVTAQTSTSINLSWTMGTGADTTIVRYNTSGYPTSPTDGNPGYSGSGTNCTISSLSPGTFYYFAAWSNKTAGNYTQYSSSSAQVSQATVAAIEITAPTNITGWPLSPQGDQPQEKTGPLNVTCSGNWQVTVKDADNTTNGTMTEWNGTAYGTIQLANFMKVATTYGGTYNVTLPTGGIIATGTGNANVTVTFKQTVSWSDQVLPGGHSYRIIVTFTGTPEL